MQTICLDLIRSSLH